MDNFYRFKKDVRNSIEDGDLDPAVWESRLGKFEKIFDLIDIAYDAVGSNGMMTNIDKKTNDVFVTLVECPWFVIQRDDKWFYQLAEVSREINFTMVNEDCTNMTFVFGKIPGHIEVDYE